MSYLCPQCGEGLTKSERLKKYYCSSCGYQIKFEEFKEQNIEQNKAENKEELIEEKLTIEEKDEKKLSEKIDEEYFTDCPYCGGEFIYKEGSIVCKNCGRVHIITPKERKFKKSIKSNREERKIGFYCPVCGEKYSVINGEIYCKTCDANILEGLEEIEEDKTLEFHCPKCKGEYIYDEITGKIACKDCGYQPPIDNKEMVIDEDSSGILSIECDKCGSNAGYSIVGDKYICKSCGNEINKELLPKVRHKKVIANDGVISKRLGTKVIRCKNCGDKVEGFSIYKTEFCPSCGTINVVVEDINSLRIEPDKIVPYVLRKEEIEKYLKNYSEIKGMKIKTTGQWKKVYIPFWQFHFEGAKVWYKRKYNFQDKNGNLKSIVLDQGRDEFLLEDVWISAREEFNDEFCFDLSKIDMTLSVLYTPEALDTLTERYDVGTTEAQVLAEDVLYNYLYDKIWNKEKSSIFMKFNDLELNYGTYKKEFHQILIPTWQNICEIDNDEYFISLNGQNGEIKIAGLDIKRRVEKEKTEEVLEKGSEIISVLDNVFSWLKK